MSSLNRRMRRENARKNISILTKNIPFEDRRVLTRAQYDEMVSNIIQISIQRTLIAAIYILWNNWGRLQKKEGRLKNFYQLYKDVIAEKNLPEAEIAAAEKAFHEQTGLKIEEVKPPKL